MTRGKKFRKNIQKSGEERENDSADADRISSLPDDILHHILGFLPTYSAVDTCVLSKRWKCIWTGIPVLDFNDREMYRNKFCENGKFLNFMEKVLGFHDRTVLEKFCLNVEGFDFEENVSDELDRLEKILSEVLRRKIQNLDFELFCIYFPFPSALYDCKTLTRLKIIGGDTTLPFPQSVCFPNLKYIKLEAVTIASEMGTGNVSFSCPVLEEARFKDFDWDEIGSMDIFVPKLVWLTIEDIRLDYDSNIEVNIYAESLVTLEVFSSLSFELCFHNLLSLYNVSIRIQSWHDIKYRASKLIQAVSNVKELILFYPTISKLYSMKDLLAFSKLENLTVNMSGSMNGELLTELFCSLPSLKSLIFMKGLDKNSLGRYDWSLEAIPQSFLLHLKSFEINGFYGNETELSLLEFLVKNVRAIEKISVASSPELSADPKKRLRVGKRLRRLYRSLVNVAIYICLI